MRGSISVNDLFDRYTSEDIKLINEVIKSNIKATTDSGMPLL
jgi:hypothetical protein